MGNSRLITYPTPPRPTSATLPAGCWLLRSISLRSPRSTKCKSRRKGTVEDGAGWEMVWSAGSAVSIWIQNLANCRFKPAKCRIVVDDDVAAWYVKVWIYPRITAVIFSTFLSYRRLLTAFLLLLAQESLVVGSVFTIKSSSKPICVLHPSIARRSAFFVSACTDLAWIVAFVCSRASSSTGSSALMWRNTSGMSPSLDW